MYTGPNIVRDSSLLVNLDATNIKSAPNASSGWKNLVDGGGVRVNNKVGSPSLTTLGGVTTWRFTAASQYFESALLGTDNQPYLDVTLEAWIYPETEVETGDRGTIMRVTGTNSLYMSFNKSNRKLSTYWYSHTNNGYHESGAAMDRDEWHHVCSVHRYNDDLLDQYTDGVKTTSTGTQADSTNYATEKTGANIEVGMENTARQFSGGICLIKVYNRALSDDEVIQNYNSVCHRFGKGEINNM